MVGKPGWSRGVRILIVGLAAALMAILVPQVASAATAHLDILWVRCDDQSEPFSDEIRLQVNGALVGGWNDVDGGETHWYYSSFPIPLGITFSGTTTIVILEQDGGDLNEIGWLNVDESEAGSGEQTRPANMFDGRYTVHYNVY